MNAKEFLQQAYFLDRQADLLLKKSELLRKSLYGHGRSDTPCRSANSDGFSRTIAKVVDYEKKADELVRKLVNVRLEIETAVAKVPDSRQRESQADLFRSSYDWKQKRELVKKRDCYLCRYCKIICKRLNTADLSVHHIVPLNVDYNKRLDENNLITLCRTHHEMAENGEIPAENF